MKRRTRTWKVLSIMLVLCLSLAGLVFAEEEALEAASEPETVVAAPLQLKTLGQESEDAYQIKITNNTGKDIDYVGISLYNPDEKTNDIVYQMQEALIKAGFLEGEADGSAGPMTQEAIAAYREANGLSADGGADAEMMEMLLGVGYDGNIMSNGDVFAAGETRVLYVPRMESLKEASEDAEKEPEAKTDAEAEETPEQAEAAAADAQAKGNDALTEAFKEFNLTPGYVLCFRSQEGTGYYYLYAFPAETMQTAQLNLDGEIPYVMYTTSGSPEPVSTLDAEKVASDVIFSMPVASTSSDNGYDTGYDAGYDYSYDAGYDYSYDTGYVEPAYEAPYIVTEEDYPSCDDGSHGVIYRVWSDGTEERIDY